MGAKFNKPAKFNDEYDKSELLIVGFLRDIHEIPIHETEIYVLCRDYYITPKYIFMYDHSAFHILNATSPNNPIVYKNVIKTQDKSTQWNKPFDLSCYIPNILTKSPNLPLIEHKQNGMSEIDEKLCGIYDGIFCRAHSKTHESGESSRSFYIFPNRRIVRNKRSKKYAHKLLQSPTGNRGKLLQYMLYCDEKYGLIGTGGALVPALYQLKLSNICDKQSLYEFKEISDEDNAVSIFGRHPGYQCKQYLMLQYLPDKEQIFAVQCKSEHGQSVGKKKKPEKRILTTTCGLYHLKENKWTKLNNFRLSTYLNDDEENFKCGLCYNRYKNEMYLVSSLGRTAKYDFQKNCWKVLYENVENFNDMSMRYDMGPIVWTYAYEPQFIYCIGGKYNKKYSNRSMKNLHRSNSNNNKNTYVLEYKKFDLRSDKRQWIDCLKSNKQNNSIIKQFKDLDFQSMFV